MSGFTQTILYAKSLEAVQLAEGNMMKPFSAMAAAATSSKTSSQRGFAANVSTILRASTDMTCEHL